MILNNNNFNKPRFYSDYVPVETSVIKGLENIQPEGFVPFLQVAKKEYQVDLELEGRIELLNEILANEKGLDLLSIFKKAMPSENIEDLFIVYENGKYDAIFTTDGAMFSLLEKIQESNKKGNILVEYIFKEASKQLDLKLCKESSFYINVLKDCYAEKIVNLYLKKPEKKTELAQKIVDCAKDKAYYKFLQKTGINNEIFKDESEKEEIKRSIKLLIDNVNNKSFKHHLFFLLKTLPVTSHPKLCNRIINTISLSFEEFLNIDISSKKFRKQVRNRINTYLINKIKRRHYEEINNNDGLLESYTPPTIRGLHSTSQKIIQEIAEFGDMSSVEDLFNHEVSSRMRKSCYLRGHTGPSNRSTTLSTKIALFFATKHGGRSEVPQDIWILLYDGKKGVYMSQVELSQGIWKEAEIATPYLKAEKCLGAVKLAMVPDKSTDDEIVLEAVDGFLTCVAKNKVVKADFFEEKIYKLYLIAQDFEKQTKEEIASAKSVDFTRFSFTIAKFPTFIGPLTQDEQVNLNNQIKEYKQNLCSYESDFIKSVIPKNINAQNVNNESFVYRIARFHQIARAQIETDLDRKQRIADEKELLSNVKSASNARSPEKFKIESQDVLNHLQSSPIPSMLQQIEPTVRHIIKNHYARRFPGPMERKAIHAPYYGNGAHTYIKYLEEVDKLGINRFVHGSMHCARTVLWVYLLETLGTKYHLFKPGSLNHALIAAAYHDAAREDDGKDYWDHESANLFAQHLEQNKEAAAIAKKLSDDLSHKDQLIEFSPASLEANLVHDADCLEILRIKSILHKNKKFDSKRLYILQKLVQNQVIHRAFMVALIQEAHSFIQVTENISHKKAVEEIDNPLTYLYVMLEMGKARFPILYQLATEQFGRTVDE